MQTGWDRGAGWAVLIAVATVVLSTMLSLSLGRRRLAPGSCLKVIALGLALCVVPLAQVEFSWTGTRVFHATGTGWVECLLLLCMGIASAVQEGRAPARDAMAPLQGYLLGPQGWEPAAQIITRPPGRR